MWSEKWGRTTGNNKKQRKREWRWGRRGGRKRGKKPSRLDWVQPLSIMKCYCVALQSSLTPVSVSGSLACFVLLGPVQLFPHCQAALASVPLPGKHTLGKHACVSLHGFILSQSLRASSASPLVARCVDVSHSCACEFI